MASIFKRHYRDANGNPSECERFTVEFRDGAGCFRQVRGYADHAASAELGRKLEKLAERRRTRDKLGGELLEWVEGLPPKLRDKLARWGILDPVGVASGKPLANHLADYRQALLDGAASSKQKGPATQKHADLVAYHVQTLLNGIGATALADVTVEAVGRYLAGRRAKKDLSVQSSNNYVKDAKAFFNWLVRSRRASSNPIAEIAKLQVTTKARKHIRRPLEHDEATNLLHATRNGPERYRMPAEERYWLYRLALETALRSSELRALTRANLRLDDAEPLLWLPGDATKNREAAELPLRADTVAALRTFVAGKHPSAPLFPNMPIVTDVAYMLRFDLKAAGVAHETDSGRVDFHALRGTCLSWLAGAGVPVKTLQDFARHSDVRLTMNLYARTLQGKLAEAAERLPDLRKNVGRAMRATGTCDPGRDSAESTALRTALNVAGNSVHEHLNERQRPDVHGSATADNSQPIKVSKNPTKIDSNECADDCAVANQSAREWMGIEPTRSRVNDPSTALKAAGPTRRPDTPLDNGISRTNCITRLQTIKR